MPNRLQNEKSPYLLQHKDNPVDWYPWGDAAFQKARDEDKPIFLSIGYSTCHWCHVMAHESFEDGKAAEVLNRFVCIKVDREERPDIDAVYMKACMALNGTGGWPLTILMTPEQKPFFAGTYFPKRELIELLKKVLHLWKMQRENLLKSGDRITSVIAKPQVSKLGLPDRQMLRQAYRLFAQNFDADWGGFGKAPKFPTPQNIIFLLKFYRIEHEPLALKMAETTLKAMAKGGIFDHIGGGFSRYSTDEKWLIPHFEKMLYDNALLMLAYSEAFQLTENVLYKTVVQKTAEYVLKELADPSGGFYCGQDADSDGIEGKYYAFTQEEIYEILGQKDGEEFCQSYDITERGNFEGKSIPNRIRSEKSGWSSDDPRLKRLYEYRKTRTRLHRDEKILFSWNAWMILALTRAGYLQEALKAQAFIEKNMKKENSRLDDYAAYSLALLGLYQATFHVQYLSQAITLAKQMIDFFEDAEHGGYFMNAYYSEKLIARPKEVYDGAMPSGNSAAEMVLECLAELTGEVFWKDAADRQHRFMAGQIKEYPAEACFSLLAMMKTLYPHKNLICSSQEIPRELSEYYPIDDICILFKSSENEEALGKTVPFTKPYPVPEHGTVWYLCENGACRAPISDFKELMR